MSTESDLEALVELSCELGRPELDYAILGEGNTSMICDADTFWIKASGQSLRTVDQSSFVAVNLGAVLALVDSGADDNATLQEQILTTLCPGSTGRPSIEVMLHALALTKGEARVAGHTHPTALLSVLCSACGREALDGRLFPDEIVICGPASAYVPYAAPGLPLARATREALGAYRDTYGAPPKVIFLENHGMIALGQTPTEVLRITAMCVKAARVLLGTFAMGGPRFLSPDEIGHIAGRPDEHYRRRVFEGRP